ncbi:DnaA regulatory inactivator Hda [Pseudothauera nasutitermitis]|uniref:DnaA regulatory inactivator Hda n=1 Tax=Pseudothauera nasutitermitis TaxID=2565930 RepID=A0A4S4AP70_9RHOO|nr:DnaA regulatory inactivator Hda [Pseudothauera nasutitermitis]THF61470.1 DnaA regulatory inactivator Hda [Pseudothauera nasutitermitis]
MKQLVLDVRPDVPPTLDNFVAGANAALLAALDATIRGESHLYLWGAPGCGRSHLLRACVAEALAAGRPAHYLADGVSGAADETAALIAVDDIERLDEAAQIELFNRFNRARERRQTLLLAGPAAPRELALREDLRTRVGQCLIYQVQALDDASRAAILAGQAQRRGLRIGDDVVDFLLRHGRRDLPSLLATLDALDQASLERKRPITLPLLRELMHGGLRI